MQKYREPKEYKRGPDTVIDGILVIMASYYPEILKYKIADVYDTITINKWFNGELTFNEFLIIFKENERLFEKKDGVYGLNGKGVEQYMNVEYY
jgi:hypothetical protein